MKRSLKILLVHNRYQHAGGEDTVFLNEARMLRDNGHEVNEYLTSNSNITSIAKKIRASIDSIWSFSGYRHFSRILKQKRPDLVHVHNFFPYPSPSIFWACLRHKVPVVWTLHNYRVMCANGLLYRDARPCTNCIGRSPLPAIRYKCYRSSRVGSAVLAANIIFHRLIGTWNNKVTRFIALTEFAKTQFVKAGLPADRIKIKPNFAEAPRQPEMRRAGALYVGRLSPEKGVEHLVKAWADVPETLTIIGDGPLRGQLEQVAGPNVLFVGKKTESEVYQAMARARLLIVPSVWFENFPMTIVEGMAAATPILASKIGALSTIIEDGVTGLHFAPGDEKDLARVANAALADDKRLRQIGENGRKHFSKNLSPSTNIELLEEIYREILFNTV